MDTRLKEVRGLRHWGQQRLIVELERAAGARGVTLPGRASLKAQVSRWENGWTHPSELYRALLRDVHFMSDEELGFWAAPGLTNVVGSSLINGSIVPRPKVSQQVWSRVSSWPVCAKGSPQN